MMSEPVLTSGSLRGRLTISLIGGAAILTVVLFFVVRGFAAQIAQQSQDNILNASATSILDAAIIREGNIELDFPYASFSMLGTQSDDRIFYVISQDGTVLSGYSDLPLPDQPTVTGSRFRTVDFRDETVRQVTASRDLVGATLRTRITVSVAQTQDDLSGILRQISRNALIFGACFFVLAALLSFWATAATIGPLRRLADSVAQRGPQDMRPIAKPVPAEMAPLVSALNHLMNRLGQSLNRSEDFIAEAAHRVRTPLATVRSHAETTLQRVEKQENRQALKAMIRAIDESSRAAGQLLDHAMITFRAEQLQRRPLDLVALVQEVVDRLTPIAEMKDIALRLGGDATVPMTGDPILLQNAVRNLVDNALKYSPGESAITLVVRSDPAPALDVSDQGPGFAPDEIDALSERFARGRNASGTIGSGLGLTIARDVAAAHGGRLILGHNPKGGACVTLSF
ncbi:sensor histidine kinase N-terminal domain-containing protein [Sedimentitalea sp. HM32M-2]|uniref:sensor histidine kinase n=1 Tax=Sedimentitalea sp. HM32M-2 TaxID=3351566 RepID=UPI003636CFE0